MQSIEHNQIRTGKLINFGNHTVMILSTKKSISGKEAPDRGIYSSKRNVNEEPLSIDEIIDLALNFCSDLPHSCDIYVNQIRELKSRLSRGKLHLAVLGQFNRGKSTFLNALIGLKILPTSVLPITSVPTIISYGDEVSCRVRFLDQKPDLVVRQSLESIQDILKKYVAEENNPNNQLCVKEVEVNCNSQLLKNGTILLDTPGFGSTHLHNTRVALTTLTECDAAIFLMSADPPLTQTELEFLKQVNLYVPRIFFVLNKTDLLTKDDLLTIDQFIKNILIMQMKYSADMELFHICAKEAENAQGNYKHKSWKFSGMDLVKTKILDFMVKEKYFTLSQALNEKFRESLNGIDSCLNEEYKNLTQPIDLLKSENKDIIGQASELKKISEKEIALIQIEEKAVIEFLRNQIDAESNNIQEELICTFDKYGAASPVKQDSIKQFSIMFNDIIYEKINYCYSVMLNDCNRYIRKAIRIHIEQFHEFVKDVRTVHGEKNADSSRFLETIEQCEIKYEKQSFDTTPIVFSPERNTIFRNRIEQLDRYKKQFQNSISVIIPKQLESVEIKIQDQIKLSFRTMHTLLEKSYGDLLRLFENSINKKDTAIQERNENSITRMATIKKASGNFKDIRKMLI